MRFLECVDLNPKITITKGQIYPFVEMANVNTCYRSPDNVDEKPFDSGVKFQDGDTVIARISPCLQNGKSFYCQNIGTGFGSTEYLVFRPKDDSVDSIYLYYFMMTDFIKLSMINSMTGATGRQRVNNDVFNDIEVCFPNIDIQRKIGEILSAYDNLIENNQKQINLLEEAAQRLYKEWFVDLHFPGYEDVKIVAGVPEGWVFVSINMVAKLKAGGDKPKTFSEKMTNENKIPVFANGITEKGLMGFTDKAVINNPSVTISARGTVGVVFLRTEPYVPIVRLISVTPIDDKIDILYLFLYLANQNFRSTGAAQQQITVPLLKSKNIVCPTDDVRKSFNDVITPIFNKIEILEKQIDFASEARDRLLPKLMSGEIEV